MPHCARGWRLRARGFWQALPHDELGTDLTYPGPWAQGAGPLPTLRHRAPRIGEHNDTILPALSPDPAPRAAAAPIADPDSKPLAGLKVLDFGWLMVGPVTTRVLADYGATVVHVESATRLDTQRLTGPHKDGIFGIDRGGDNAQRRTSHLGVSLNLKTDAGQEIARRLVAWADVVVDNFAGGARQRMGFGYDALRAIKPDIISLSCSGQGGAGPHIAAKGGGSHYVALSGLQEITGPPDGPPSEVSVLTDFIAPRFNTALLLAAIDHRDRTGEGAHFDVSQLEAAVTFTAPLMLDYFANGRVPTRLGNRHPAAAPHGAYPCADGRWCTIAVFSAAEWRAFIDVIGVDAIGAPRWTQDPRFASLAGRKQHEDELDEHIRAWTRDRRPDEVTRLLQEAGVPAGEVVRGQELLDEDPQLAHRGYWQSLEHPEIGPHWAMAHGFCLSAAPLQMTPAPLLGQHTRRVMREILAMPDDEVAALTAKGVFD